MNNDVHNKSEKTTIVSATQPMAMSRECHHGTKPTRLPKRRQDTRSPNTHTEEAQADKKRGSMDDHSQGRSD
jgi:hypothetical protein